MSQQGDKVKAKKYKSLGINVKNYRKMIKINLEYLD
jgi:hypothetical protein